MNPRKVWLIDDDAIFTFTVQRMINKFQKTYDLEAFGNGKLAADRLNEVEADELPDVILLDINMPVMDGWQFLDVFTDYSHKNNLMLFLVSSSIDPKDINKSKRYDEVKDFISKPLTPKKLSNILKVVDQETFK